METSQTHWGKNLKIFAKVSILILGLLIFTGLILLPVSASFAHGIDQLGTNLFLSHENNNNLLKQTALLTDTITATSTLTGTQPTLTITASPTLTITQPTVTITPSPTLTGTPPTATITSSPTLTGTQPTVTITPSPTLTGTQPTVTITPSPTLTGTPPTATITPSPTLTGTQPTATKTPSPTVTGTLTVVPSLKISVAPYQAKVNETFTFTIEAGNTGTGPSHNNIVINASFPNYIVINTVTTSKGIITPLTRSFTVSIGDLSPGEKVTIIAIVKVNSSPSQTEYQSNTVTLTYDVGKSVTTSVPYKVISTTLPGTGELPLNWRQERIKPIAIISGLFVMGLGGILLFMMVRFKNYNHTNKLWMAVGGALLILIGFVLGVSTSGLINLIGQAQMYLMTPTSDGLIANVIHVEPSKTILPRLPASAFSTPDSVIPIVTLPDYPIPTPVLTVTPLPGEIGPDTSEVVRIIIPALFLDTQVKYVPFDGNTWLINGLRQEVAWMGNTSWPGLGGNTGLAGHVTVAGMGDGPFRHLDELPNGELVLLYTEKNIYTYQVRESRVTDDGDMSVTYATVNPQITLITCTDWDQETRTYLKRLVVMADLVRTEPITNGKTP